jgi:hypothetical protein
MNLADEFLSLAKALNTAGISYALCGGLAVAVYGHARATKDIDMLVLADEIEKISKAVAPLGFTLHSGRIPLGIGTSHPQDLYRVSKAAGTDLIMLDLLVVNENLRTIWEERQERAVEGITIQVISKEGLLAMKQRAGRPQDLADIAALIDKKGAEPSDE